jgi:hypothetical protein
MTYRQATALIFCALICVTGVSGMAFTSPSDARCTDWNAEVLLFSSDLGPSYLGVTHIDKRPFIVELHVGLKMYPGLQRWVVAHELFHALGWVGHPFSDKGYPLAGAVLDGTVILMDTSPFYDTPEDVPAVLELSELERCFLRRCAGTLAVIVDANDIALVDALIEVAVQLNDAAGRTIIEIRAGPVTME